MLVTVWMCFVRYVKIRAPLWARGHKKLMNLGTVNVLALIFIINIVGQVLSLLNQLTDDDDPIAWFSPIQFVIAENKQNAGIVYVLSIAPFYTLIVLSGLFSTLTIVQLRSAGGMQVQEEKRRRWAEIKSLCA